MRKSTTENIVILTAAFLLAFITIVFMDCKKKEQSLEAQSATEAQKTETSEKIGLRILYTGLPNTDRAKDFVDFLTRHFQQVETTDYKTFTGSHTADFDVAIVDHDGADTSAPRLRISRQYARATVTVGVPGAFLCSNLSLKTGYLWNCMADAAHAGSLEHEVFSKPFKVEPQFHYFETPHNYHDRHLGNDKLPDRMKVWLVQQTGKRYGSVVARSYGFTDSPDAESLILGFNTGKEYGAVGIGRHGNFL